MSEQAVPFLEKIRPYLVYIVPVGVITGIILLYLYFRGKKKGKEE